MIGLLTLECVRVDPERRAGASDHKKHEARDV